MIKATFFTDGCSIRPDLFRGKDIHYWIEKVFTGVDFIKSGDYDLGFDFLIIFDSEKFLEIDTEGVTKIIEFLKGESENSETIFSLTGYPFFILSKHICRKFKLRFSKRVRKNIAENGDIKTINLGKEYQVLNLDNDSRRIESFIVSCQVVSFRKSGVIIEDYNNFYIEDDISIGEGTTISSGVVIKGKSEIGKNVKIYPNNFMENSIIGDNSCILPGCVIKDSQLEDGVQIGPFSHLRKGSLMKCESKIGNFVEMKKSIFGKRSKSMHLSYIGDAVIGENVNIGAGTITCNFDGVNKNTTIIEDNVFIGSGTELIAPIILRKNSYVGAGSTISEDVPENSLAVSRERQRNISGWVERKKRKKPSKKK